MLPMGCSGACSSSLDPDQTLTGVPAGAATLPQGSGLQAEHVNGAARVQGTPAEVPCECGVVHEPNAVLLFCRTLRSPDRESSPSRGPSAGGGKLQPFVYCGRLGAPHVNWDAAGGYGEVAWTLLARVGRAARHLHCVQCRS